MNQEKLKTIETTLREMKKDVLFLKTLGKHELEAGHKKVRHKYNAIFVGEEFKQVLGLEVASYLKINHEEFIKNLPPIADKLGMRLEEMYTVESISKSNPTKFTYWIYLF